MRKTQEGSNMIKALFSAAIALGFAASAAQAQQVVTREPPLGALQPGQKILVDNGRCPKGQVQEVTGGTYPSQAQRNAAATAGTNVNAGGQPRQRRCVARP
jgi:hypothetical protein